MPPYLNLMLSPPEKSSSRIEALRERSADTEQEIEEQWRFAAKEPYQWPPKNMLS